MDRYGRWNALVELLIQQGQVTVAEAAARLDVSPATIRRDFEQLAQQRLITRSRGGAAATGSYDLPLRYKTVKYAAEKQRIGGAAAGLVEPGMVVGLNGGTTTTEVARALVARPDLPGGEDSPPLTVVTNALNIAYELSIRPNVNIVVTGGAARTQSYELVGPLSEGVLSKVHIDTAILGVDGISTRAGLTTIHPAEAKISADFIAAAQRTIVVADSTKLEHPTFARIGDLSGVSMLVTDRAVPEPLAKALAEGGTEIVVTSER